MKLIVLLLFLCLCLQAGAQINWAVNTGAQISYASYKRQGEKIPVGSVTGFTAGLLAKIYFDDKVAFVSGMQYNTRGFTVKTIPGDTQRSYRLHYIDVPAMVQVDLSREKGKGWYCKFGPSVGIGLSGKEKHTGINGTDTDNKVVLSLTGNYFGLFDASMNGALGFAFTRNFFAEAAYAYGIGNINNDPDGPNIKSRVASLHIGYFFR